MRWRDDLLIAGTAVSLGLAALLVVTSLRPADVAGGSTPVGPQVPSSSAAELALPAASEASIVRARAPRASDADDGAFVDEALRLDATRREDAAFAELQAYGLERGREELVLRARTLLAARGESVERKLAALRVLDAAQVADLDDVLAGCLSSNARGAAGTNVSLLAKRALTRLGERAASDETARRALARIAFVADARIAPTLRDRATVALVASIPGARRAAVEGLLRAVATGGELDDALGALARDARFIPGD